MKKQNRIRLFFFFVIAAIMSVSCTSEESEEQESGFTATLRLTFKMADDAVTRALSSNNENMINDVTVLIFDSNSRLIGSKYVDGLSTTTSVTTTVTTRVATGCTAYVIANTGSSSYFAEVNTVEELNAKYATLSGPTVLNDNATNVLMVGSAPVNITEGSNSVSILIKHLCSKVNISIVPSSDITITGYRLCSAALGSYIIDSHSSAGTTVTAPANNNGNSYGDFGTVTIGSSSAGATVSTPIYYVYENLAGSNSNCTTEQARTTANAPANAMYLLVYAKTSSWHSIYRIYLGGMTNTSTPEADLSNFNVYRNMNYTYKINITGSGQSDARVTYTTDISIGDIYYSDGTWSSTLDESKTPVGIIFSTTTSTTDYNNGYTHGYAMALKDAASCVAWCISSAAYVSAQLQSSLTNTVVLEENNLDGLTETNTIKAVSDYGETNYPACYDAINYSTTLPSSGTSGWYLPSIGQWYLIVKNLGGVTAAATSASSDTSNYNYWTNTSISAASAINTYLNKAGSTNIEAIDCNSSKTRWYWCSSEYNRTDTNLMFFISDGTLYLYYTGKTYTDTNSRVRSVLAF